MQGSILLGGSGRPDFERQDSEMSILGCKTGFEAFL